MNVVELFPDIKPEHFMKRYLNEKGVKEELHDDFLYPTLDLLEDFNNYKNGKEVADKIIDHIKQEHKITLVMHVDLDSLFSNVIMYKFLKRFDVEIDMIFPTVKQQGFNPVVMEHITECGSDLVIMLDAGSTGENEIEILQEMGIDVVILDHHPTSEKMAKFPFMFNNTISDVDNKCGSGCLVTWKMIKYIGDKIGIVEDKTLMDFAAVSLLSDVMNLTTLENRALIHATFHEFKDPLLNHLAEKLGRSQVPGLIPAQWSWNINPSINGLIRLGNVAYTTAIFNGFVEPNKSCQWVTGNKRTMNGTQLEYASYLIRNRGKDKKELVDNLYKILQEEIEDDKIIMVFSHGRISQFLGGDIANKVSGEFLKPCLCFMDGDDEEFYYGSARSQIPIRKTLADSGIFEFALGHEQAFGFKIAKNKIDELKKFISKMELKPIIPTVIKKYQNKMPLELFHIIDDYKEVFGKGIETPMFYIEVEVVNQEIYRGKANLLKWSNYGIEFLLFYSSEEVRDKLDFDNKTKFKLALMGQLEVNKWNDCNKPQFMIRELEFLELDIPKEEDWEKFF